MPTPAPNFQLNPAAPPPYPKPVIHSASTRAITVDTSAGPRSATEVTLRGEHFLIRAVDPDVTINGQRLVRFRIDDDQKGLVGYFFGSLSGTTGHVVVDYGRGVRGHWSGHLHGGQPGREVLFWLLLIALILLVIGAVLVALNLTAAGLVLIAVAAVLMVIALLRL
jgi:hypothetical protein